MVQLFLNNTEVVPDAGTTIKVTKENPYFTLSDSYTLEVSVPLDIYENKLFFGHIDRTEKAKSYKEYDARLVVNNKTILHGQARITQSTSKEVKLQLTTGVSALKMTAVNNDLYIDEMDLGKYDEWDWVSEDVEAGKFINRVPGTDLVMEGRGIPLYDSTNDIHVNLVTLAQPIVMGGTVHKELYHMYVSACPKLVDIAKLIAFRLGYSLDTSCLPDACNHIYIISACMSHRANKKLPHWTVSEFYDQFQNFFGCTIEDTDNKQLKLSPLNAYVTKQIVELSPVEDFDIDYTEEDSAKGVINSNLEYSMNGSDIELIDEEILQLASKRISFNNISSAKNHFKDASKEERMSYLYDINGELYIGWEDENDNANLKRIAPFNPLVRYKDASSTSLKISPVYIVEDEEYECQMDALSVSDHTPPMIKLKMILNLPEVKCNTDVIYRNGSNITNDGGTTGQTIYNLQELISGEESVEHNEDKEDVMSVAFFDGKKEDSRAGTAYADGGYTTYVKDVALAFTDSNFKTTIPTGRKKWSLSLNKIQGFDFYLGQMHELQYQCSRKCKLKASFISEEIPDAKSIFIIRNKRYACEKIEADIKDGELSNLMTGYFYEMKDADAHE